MPPHNSSDSWIDLSEIAKLVEQLMPSGQSGSEPPPQLPPMQESSPVSPSSLDDAPVSLIPEIPSAWERALPESLSSFPSLDDLEVPETPGATPIFPFSTSPQANTEPETAEPPKEASQAEEPKPIVASSPKPESEAVDEPAPEVEAESEESVADEVDVDEDIAPPKVISMQSKVRADETLAHIRRLGRGSIPESADHEPFLKAETDDEPVVEAEVFLPAPEIPEKPEPKPEPPAAELPPVELPTVEPPAAELPPAPPEPETPALVEAPQKEAVPTAAPAEEKEPTPTSDSLTRALFLPRGSLRLRLQAYGDWVREVTECTRFQVTDGQGYSLLEDENEQEASFVGSALQLMKVLEAVGPKIGGDGAGGGVYLPLSAEQWLCVLGAETRYGPVCLSMVTRAPLSAPAAEELTRTLRRTLEAVG